eukprot:TRINITY_DN3006_c0_g1_i1.p1 TRINITY_DN3006_c0_g1~~TRINITY_DN3006_c0_g1_i1.p1  ORF type:complete len:609 (-),score=97.34 TRINITY_DN3006_c0_g1_i1:239-1852(-)
MLQRLQSFNPTDRRNGPDHRGGVVALGSIPADRLPSAQTEAMAEMGEEELDSPQLETVGEYHFHFDDPDGHMPILPHAHVDAQAVDQPMPTDVPEYDEPSLPHHGPKPFVEVAGEEEFDPFTPHGEPIGEYHFHFDDDDELARAPIAALGTGAEQTESLVKPSCKKRGCGSFRHGSHCQCNSGCKKHGNCCHDFGSTCAKKKETFRPLVHVLGNITTDVSGVFGHPFDNFSYPTYEGFTLTLAEEFEDALDLDNDPIWTWSDGALREGAVRFVKEQIRFENGRMVIEVSNKKPTEKVQACSMAAKELVPYKPLISGELRARHNMFRYGVYEVRMKAPVVQPGKPHLDGNFIASMFVYRDANAHHWREIEFEVTGDHSNSVLANVLYADNTINWRAYLQDSKMADAGKVNLRADFHTYMFEWTPKKVAWYLDGKVIRKGTTLTIPDKSCKIMMNTWVFSGGRFGGWHKENNRYPLRTEYEYFRFYKWDQDTLYPCHDMRPSCLTEDDHFLATNNPCDGLKQQGLLHGRKPCKAICYDD